MTNKCNMEYMAVSHSRQLSEFKKEKKIYLKGSSCLGYFLICFFCSRSLDTAHSEFKFNSCYPFSSATAEECFPS